MSAKKDLALTLSAEDKKKFADLPAWQKEFIKRVIDSQDVLDAAKATGVARYVGGLVDGKAAKRKSIQDALEDGGITRHSIVAELKECLDAKCLRFDKEGNPIEYVDTRLKLAAIELISKLAGYHDDKPPPVVDLEMLEMFKDVEV